MGRNVIAAILVTLSLATSVAGEENIYPKNTDVSSIRVEHFRLEGAHVTDVLKLLAINYKIVIGLSGSSVGSEFWHDTFDIGIDNGTVKDVLDALVKIKPSYRWHQDQNGVVMVEFGSRLSLLDLSIGRLDLKRKTRAEISREIKSLPQMDPWLREQRCAVFPPGEDSGGLQGMHYVEDMTRFTFHFRNESLGAIISKIAQKDTTFFWFIVRIDDQSGPCYVHFHLESHMLRHV